VCKLHCNRTEKHVMPDPMDPVDGGAARYGDYAALAEGVQLAMLWLW
jgi:hypothetical protein